MKRRLPAAALPAPIAPAAAEDEQEPSGAPVLPAAADGAVGKSIADVVQHGVVASVKSRAQEWAELCRHDLTAAILEALSAVYELAGLPGAMSIADLEAEPAEVIRKLPDWVRNEGRDPSVYALVHQKQGRKAVGNFEKFWTFGLGAQNGEAILDSNLAAALCRWLLTMPQSSIRSLRHVATVAALAVAEAFAYHHQALSRTLDTLQRQLTAGGGRNRAREAQLKQAVASAEAHVEAMSRARLQLLETTVPSRSRDVSEVIRLYTLSELERLMQQSPELYLQNKWTSRVFLMIHDPSVEVRLKAIGVIQQWYSPSSRKSEAVQQHLKTFAEKGLPHIVERIWDVDGRVAAAAVRCLRSPALADRLKEEDFDTIVNLCIGHRDSMVREEAAVFINSHVFTDPGICTSSVASSSRRGREERRDGDDDDDDDVEAKGGDAVKEHFNAETSLSMLVEFLENYVGENLRLTERAVAAFWNRAPCLHRWVTMVNLCLLGESQRGVGMGPVTSRQRLTLLYIMEAAVRRSEEDFRLSRGAEKDAASIRMHDACSHIIPEIPRLFKVCRPEEQHTLLLSHICKILIEHAVENSQNHVLANVPALCSTFRTAIETTPSLDTCRYFVDALLSLGRCFDEAKNVFLDLSKAVNAACVRLLETDAVDSIEKAEEFRKQISRFTMISNRGLNMTFGESETLLRLVALLDLRATWAEEAQTQASLAADPAADETADGQIDGPASALAEAMEERPAGIPDARMTVMLIEAAVTSLMWHVKLAFWIESAEEPEARQQAEAQVAEMLQGHGEIPAIRAELPHLAAKLRESLVRLINLDFNAHVRFHAYFGYMAVVKSAVGASEKVGLQMAEDGGPAAPTAGSTYEVLVPNAHMKVLWGYLNRLYTRISGEDGAGVNFSAEGQKTVATSVHPAPSQDTMTSVRHLTLRFLEGSMEDEAKPVSREDAQLQAVLASRAVVESELEDIHSGVLGLLLLTQCERARPSALRDVSLLLLRRLREMAKVSEDCAVQYYRMQGVSVTSLFKSVSLQAALALSLAFTRQWALRNLPWLEQPFFCVLREQLVNCISADKKRLPLLEAFSLWIKNDFLMQESRCRSLAAELKVRCASAGINADDDPHVSRLLRRLVQPAPIGAASEAAEAEEVADVPSSAKRHLEPHSPGNLASPGRTRKRAKTADPDFNLDVD